MSMYEMNRILTEKDLNILSRTKLYKHTITFSVDDITPNSFSFTVISNSNKEISRNGDATPYSWSNLSEVLDNVTSPLVYDSFHNYILVRTSASVDPDLTISSLDGSVILQTNPDDIISDFKDTVTEF